MLTLPQRIAPIVEAVLAQIKLKANLFHIFMDVLRRENSCLGDVIQQYYCKLILTLLYVAARAHNYSWRRRRVCYFGMQL